MSVNSYTQGCHLLNHDDVIGTRRVSYILYMPLPYGQVWQKEWGGALELYPVQTGSDGIPEPEAAPSKAIPPSWNQFIFFEVQPGRSFHSVEEVVVGADGMARLSISGWFHAAQEGEDGYQADQAAPELKSSREQLVCICKIRCLRTTVSFEITTDIQLYLFYLIPRIFRASAPAFVTPNGIYILSFKIPEPSIPSNTHNEGVDGTFYCRVKY